MLGKIKDGQNIIETVIGSDTTFNGKLHSKGSVRLDGRAEGQISAEQVIVGTGGQITGDIHAKVVVVGGRVRGNITASGSLEMQSPCQVLGDISTPQLSIAEGAKFEGTCSMTIEKSPQKQVEEILSKA